MPISPSSYATNTPITAHQLNQDLFSIDGSYFNVNGTSFHANRPLLVETFIKSGAQIAAPSGGAPTFLGGVNGDAISVVDNAALYGTGADGVGNEARFNSGGAVAPGSSGISGQYGGWNLMFAFVPLAAFPIAGGMYGVEWNNSSITGNPPADIGCMQPASPVYHNAGFACDMVELVPPLYGTDWGPSAYALSPTSARILVALNTVTTVGETPRFTQIWTGVLNGYGTPVASVPSPMTVITGLTTLSSTALNSTINQSLNLLNYPPMLDVTVQSTAPINASSVTTVPFTNTPVEDNYSGYNVSTHTYTVPLSGLYFMHANLIYSPAFTVGTAIAGFEINGAIRWGGAYAATPSANQDTGASVTKLFDLNAGDTVQVITATSVTAAFGSANYSHFIMNWMGALNSSAQSWKPPNVTGFQFAAGTPPESITNIVQNSYFTAGTNKWTGFNGSFTVTSSPAAGAPYPNAGVYVNNGSASGAMEGGGTFQVDPTEVVYLDAWTWTSGTVIQAGFDFENSGTYVTSVLSNFTVPTQTWKLISLPVTAPSLAINSAYARVGTPSGSGATIQTQAILAGFQRPLAPQLNEKIANDLNFLINRPYLMARQTTATSGTVNTAITVPMQTATGLIHNTFGDNYGGWNGTAYTAQVPGWYLAVEEIGAATRSTANSGDSLTAGFSVPTSGGVPAPTTPQSMPDWYQQIQVAGSWTYPTAATAIGAYYLNTGESIYPSARYQSGTATSWTTDTSHSFNSQFSLIWLSS